MNRSTLLYSGKHMKFLDYDFLYIMEYVIEADDDAFDYFR